MKIDIKIPSESVIIIKTNKHDKITIEFLPFRINEIKDVIDKINIENVVTENKVSSISLKEFAIILLKDPNPNETSKTIFNKIVNQ